MSTACLVPRLFTCMEKRIEGRIHAFCHRMIWPNALQPPLPCYIAFIIGKSRGKKEKTGFLFHLLCLNPSRPQLSQHFPYFSLSLSSLGRGAIRHNHPHKEKNDYERERGEPWSLQVSDWRGVRSQIRRQQNG
jgi:hypothetical protein